MPKRASLPSMLPPGCSGAGGLVGAERGQRGLPCCSRHDATTATTNIAVIAASTAQPWRGRPPCGRRRSTARRDQEDRQHLQEVGQRRRVLVRVRRVGVEEAAAVGAQHLDRLLRGDRAHRQGLRANGLVLHHRVPRPSAAGRRRPFLAARRHGLERARPGRARSSGSRPGWPAPARTRSDSGSSTYSRDAVRSTQKLPIDCVPRRAKPRISANATTMPVAADRKFCTASASICVR
jgi:hypothetical protein